MAQNTVAILGLAGVGALLFSGLARSKSGGTRPRPPLSPLPPLPDLPRLPVQKPIPKNPLARGGSGLPKVGLDLAAARREAPSVSSNVIARGYDYDTPKMAIFQGHAGLSADGIYGPQTRSALRYFGIQDPPGALFKGTATPYAPPAGPPAAPQLPANAGSSATDEDWGGGGGSFGGGGASGSWEASDEPLPISHSVRAAKLAASGGGTPGGVEEDDAPAPAPAPAPLAPPTPINLDLARREAPRVAQHIAQKKQNYTHQVVADFQKHAGLVPDGKYGPVTREALGYFGVKNPPPAIFGSKVAGATYRPPT